MKFSERIEQVKLRAGASWREFKEKREEAKAQKEQNGRLRALQDGKEIGFDRNPRRIRFAVLLATWGVLGFLVLWIAQTVGNVRLFVDAEWKLGEAPRFDYDIAFAGDILSLLVLSVVSFAIVLYSKAWVSYFMDTPWRDWGSKLLSLTLGVGGSAAIIMGGFEVNQHIRQEDFRGALVEEQAATQDRVGIQSRIATIDRRLTAMRDQASVGTYAAIAASVGAEAYRRDYMSEEAMRAEEPVRRRIIQRALGAATAADTLENERETLQARLDQATPVAATAATVTMDDPVSRFLGDLGPWRIVLLVLVGDLILLFGTYLADKREERARGYHVPEGRSGWATDAEQIPDMRGEEAVKPQPMKPAREVVTDAETGEELVKVKPKEYWRKRKGKVQKLEITPEIPDDETGFQDKSRTAVTLGGEMEVPSATTADEISPGDQVGVSAEVSFGVENAPAPAEAEAAEQVADAEVQTDANSGTNELRDEHFNEAQPDLPEELPEIDLTDEAQNETEQADQNDTVQEDNAEPDQREPETNPARMIAAE